MDKNAIYNSTNEQVPLSAEKVAEVPKTLSRLSGLRFLLSSLRGNPHKLLEKLYRKHGENFIIPPNIVIINDPKAIRDVLEVHNLPKTPKVRFGYKSIFYGGNARSSGGILAAPWQKWIEQRRMTAPALAEKAIGSLAVKFHNASLPFFAYIDSMVAENRPIDMSEAFTAVTMDIIGKILLGKTFGMCESLQTTTKDKNVPFASALHILTDEAVRQMVLPGWWLRWRPKAEKVEAARAVIDDFLEECIRARLSQTEADGNKRQLLEQNTTDLMDILVAAEADGVISRKEVKGQLLTFVFAGFDTLAPTLTYMLWEVRIDGNAWKLSAYIAFPH